MSDISAVNSFLKLEPGVILAAVESVGLRCTGRCLQLNSLENRVYEVEIERFSKEHLPTQPLDFIVAKFYRPGRWTLEQISQEHTFLRELDDESIGVVPALEFSGRSVFNCPLTGIYFALFPKFSGRNADEFRTDELQIIARSIARIHLIGSRHAATARVTLNYNERLTEYLTYLKSEQVIPENFLERISTSILQIEQLARPFTAQLQLMRIHGDAHKGNLIKRNDSFYWVDFDDFCNGPAVQDLWLLFPGRDQETRKQLQQAVDAYLQLKSFDRSSLFMIEPLRTLRVLYFNVWIHKRWSDQYFKRTFEAFGTDHYWQEQLIFFAEQLSVFQEIVASGEPLLSFEN